jgi:hypothetical protein
MRVATVSGPRSVRKLSPFWSRLDHLKTVGRKGEKCVRAVGMAAPHLFNERMVGVSVFQMKELTIMSHHFVQTLACGHHLSLP